MMPTAWSTVRVFTSSTFRDMQAERNHLVRVVFPRLREDLLRTRIHFADMDLRWGVTSDQDSQAVCRKLVDECRPRFVCLLDLSRSIDAEFGVEPVGELDGGSSWGSDAHAWPGAAAAGNVRVPCVYAAGEAGTGGCYEGSFEILRVTWRAPDPYQH